MNTDRRDAIRAINEARDALDRLEARIFPSSALSIQAQAESAMVFLECAGAAHRIGSELTVKLAGIGCALAERELSNGDLQDLRSSETLDDVTADARDWASEILNAYEAA